MTNLSVKNAVSELSKYANSDKALIYQRFFKTNKGEYGEGDKFIGVSVPVVRSVASNSKGLTLFEIEKLLKSKIHEHRLTALIILTIQFEKSDQKAKQKIYRFYLRNRRFINNWDLVDASSYKIVGKYLQSRNKEILYKLAKSKSLWDRRIAIVSTLAFIKDEQHEDTFAISKLLLNDKEDLIHKAVGWMLREAGKKDVAALEGFLAKHYSIMPRTALRYAIEKFPKERRQKYLRGEIA